MINSATVAPHSDSILFFLRFPNDKSLKRKVPKMMILMTFFQIDFKDVELFEYC